MMDTCQIVSGNELRRLQRHRKLSLLGWIVAGGLALALALAVGELRSMRLTLVEVKKLKAEVIEVQQQQVQVTAAFAKAWENQQATAEALISWGQYSMDRKQIIDMNKNAVTTLTRTQNERARSSRIP